MKASQLMTLTALCGLTSLEAHAALKIGDLSCQTGRTMEVNFPVGEVPFPSGTMLKTQLKSAGLTFATSNSQGNLVRDGSFYNPERINFVTAEPVFRVSITLSDDNSNLQTHILSAYDKNNVLLDTATFTDPSWNTYPQLCGMAGGCQSNTPDRFTLTASSCKGIAYVVLEAQGPGAQILENVVFSMK